MTSPSFSQIRARAESLYKPDAPQRVIGIRLAVPLRVAELGEVKGRKCFFNWCDSPLEIRELLVAREADESLQVVLTDLDEQDLGQDLLARFVKRRLFHDDAWQTLQEHFRARQTDPALKKHRWLAAMLIEAMPPGGYAPVASGVLDAETVWGIVLKEQFGFAGARPDARDLLAWTSRAENLARYTAALPEFKQELRPWLRQSAGELADAILDCLDAGWGETAVSIGLACQVVFNETDDAAIQSELHRAAARMEQYIGNRTLKPAEAEAWRNAAESLIDRWFDEEESRPTARRALERADRLLADLKIADLAWLGQHSPSGFDQALERYGEALRAFCQEGKFAEVPRGLPPGLLDLAKTIFQHKQSLAGDSAARVEAVEMSLRLLRWLGQEPSEPKNFEEAARAYAMEGGFVDRARYALYRGDAAPALSDAYAQLVSLVTARREAENRRFAELMVKWIEAGARGKDVVKIENVLEQVVACVAGSRPVLLIVMDGMGYAVFSELLEKITERGWVEIAAEDRVWPAPVIAALPSITRVSRASLLCGKLTQGGSAEERAGFASNEALGEALRKVSKASAPVLFHKNNLNAPDEPGDIELSADWRQALSSENQRIVGVVVNAVDDHLDKGDQLNLEWSVETISLLDRLLYAARDAGRAVIITSDHGHIIERQTVYREPLDTTSAGASGASVGASVGERHRGAEGTPAANELLVRGRRVLPGKIIAPWSEQVRYTRSKKHGYHGGLTPQECVVPGCVLVRYDPKGDYGLEGWKEREAHQPSWWSRQDQPPSIIDDRAAQSRKPGKKPAKEMPLFAGARTGAGNWLDRLFESGVFAAQHKLAGRGAPKLEDARRFLDVLAPRGGKALKLTMAQQLGLPELRIAGLVASMRRILNVDGYAVLDVEESSSTICLDIELLKLQFGLDENDD